MENMNSTKMIEYANEYYNKFIKNISFKDIQESDFRKIIINTYYAGLAKGVFYKTETKNIK